MGVSAAAAKEENLVEERGGLELRARVGGRVAKRRLASGVARFGHDSRRGGAVAKPRIVVEKSGFWRGKRVSSWVRTVTQGSGADARITTNTYDANGYLASITDPLNRITSFPEYDLADRLKHQVLPGNRDILLSYDANGNLTSVTPPGRPAHLLTYTPVNLLETYTPPDVGSGSTTTTYQYNKDRQPTTVIRPDGLTVVTSYDTAGRVSTITTPTGVITYGYNPTTGTVSSVSAPGGVTLSYTWDGSLLKDTTWNGPVTGTVSRNYNTDFDVSSLTVGGTSVSFARDNDRLLTAAGALTVTRDTTSGFVTGTTLGTVTTARSYNTLGELGSASASAGATTLYSASYPVRDALGRIKQLDETIQGVSSSTVFDYDTAGRFWRVSRDGVLEAEYLYDLNGNRTTVTNSDLGLSTSATYDAQDRLLTYGSTSYTYTKAGELLTKTDANGTATYGCDVLGNLRSVGLPNGTQIDYLIDAQRRRVGKKVNGVLVQGFLWEDQLRVAAEVDGNGNVVSRFVYAEGVNVPEYIVKGGTTYRIISDHLGSPRLVVDITTGTVAQRIDYDEWGVVHQDTSPGFQPFGFGGGLYDQHTKLVRFGVRDYDAEVGRWTAKDPPGRIARDRTNLYEYGSSDPLNKVDPDGRQWSIILKMLGPTNPLLTLFLMFGPTVCESVFTSYFSTAVDPDKEHCIKLYVNCINQGWKGPCGDCLHKCTTQLEWDFELCYAKK